MKSIKIILIIVVAVVIGAAVFLLSSLDGLVKTAIEEAGTQVTQTRVAVGEVKLTPTSGEGTIKNLQVDSPAGFSRKQIFTLGEVTIAIDPKTITEKVVVIDKVIIKSPQIFYEINDKGDSNLDVLKKNVEQATAKMGSTGKSDAGGDEVKIIIRKFVIEGAEVDARIAALGGKDLSANIPRIQLNNLGKDTGGATAGEIAEKVTNVLISKTTTAVAELGAQQFIGKTAEEAKAELERKAKETVIEKLGDQIGGALESLF
ncbi:MAG: hypothetical protein KAT25_05445 [Sulfuriflexus sp.]|nr:hypothetical protein [Sulfuriflexus sp.]